MPSPGWVQPELPFQDAELRTFFSGIACLGLEVNGLRMTEPEPGRFQLVRIELIEVPSWSRLGPIRPAL